MGNLALELRQKAQSISPGSVVTQRGRNWIKHTKPSGSSYILDSTIGPLHYGVNNDLEIDTAWKVESVDGYSHSMTANNFTTRIRTNVFNSGNIFRFEKNGEYLQFDPQSINFTDDSGSRQQIAIKQGISGVVSDDRVTYSNAYGPGIDFIYQNQSSRLQKLIRISSLSNLPTPTLTGSNIVFEAEFSMSLSSGISFWIDGVEWTKGNNVRVKTANNVEVRDSSGSDILWWLGVARAIDSNGDDIIGEIEVRRQGGPSALFITVRIPYTWLASATFPVFIDPTIDDQVDTGYDDSSQQTSGSMQPTATSTYCSTSAFPYCFMRHTAPIDQGVVIDVAYQTIRTSNIDDPDLTIYAEDAASPPTSSTDMYYISNRTRTSASASWVATGLGNNTFVNTPSIVSIIQELVDSYTITDIAIIWVDNGNGGSIRWNTYENSTSYAPQIHIEYSAGASGNDLTANSVEAHPEVGKPRSIVDWPQSGDWNAYQASAGISPGTTSDWDEVFWGGAPGHPVKYNGIWYFYFTGSQGGDANGDENRSIGLATSMDFISWTKHASNPLITYTTTGGTELEEGASNPVVFIDGSTWHMWYAASRYTAPSQVDVDIRYRTSSDGITWTGDVLVYSVAGQEYVPVGVYKDGSTYYLLIIGDLTSGRGDLNYLSGTTPSTLSGKTTVASGLYSGRYKSVTDLGDGTVLVANYDASNNYEWYTLEKSNPTALTFVGEYASNGYETGGTHRITNGEWYSVELKGADGAFYTRATVDLNPTLNPNSLKVLPELETPSASSVQNLSATGVESVSELETASIGQTHELTALGVESVSELETASIGQTHELTALGIESVSELETTSIGQTHELTALGIESVTEVGTPTASQSTYLDATGVKSTTEVETPSFGQTHNLSATGLESLTEVEIPALGQTHGLAATGIKSATEVGTPGVGQTHNLAAVGAKSASKLGKPIITGSGYSWGDLVQYKTGTVPFDVPQTSITVNYDSTPTEGNLLIAASYSGNGDITAPSGWNVAYWLTQPVNDDEGGLFYKIAGASESTAVTVTAAASNEHTLIIAEFQGPWAASPLDTEDHDAYATGDAARSLSTSTLTQADNLVVGYAAGRDQGAEPVLGGGGFAPGFTQLAMIESTNKWTDVDYKLVNSTAALSVSWDATNYYDTGHHAGIAVFMKGAPPNQLEANSLKTTPKVGSPTAGMIYDLAADGITVPSSVEQTTIGQTHELVGGDLSSSVKMVAPSIGQTHNLGSNGVKSATKVGLPASGILQVLSADGISSQTKLATPDIHVRYQMESMGIVSQPLLGAPTLIQADALIANGLHVQSSISGTTFGQIHAFQPIEIGVISKLKRPAIAQTHVLVAVGTSILPVLKNPEVNIPLVAGTIGITSEGYKLDLVVREVIS